MLITGLVTLIAFGFWLALLAALCFVSAVDIVAFLVRWLRKIFRLRL